MLAALCAANVLRTAKACMCRDWPRVACEGDWGEGAMKMKVRKRWIAVGLCLFLLAYGGSFYLNMHVINVDYFLMRDMPAAGTSPASKPPRLPSTYYYASSNPKVNAALYVIHWPIWQVVLVLHGDAVFCSERDLADMEDVVK